MRQLLAHLLPAREDLPVRRGRRPLLRLRREGRPGGARELPRVHDRAAQAAGQEQGAREDGQEAL